MRVAIIAHPSDKHIAKTIAVRLEQEEEVCVAICGGQESVRRFVANADFLIIIWSWAFCNTKKVKSLPERAYELNRARRVFSILVDGCAPEREFGEAQAARLSSPTEVSPHDGAYWWMYARLMTAAGFPDRAARGEVLAKRGEDLANKSENERCGKPERRRYDYRELAEYSKKASHELEGFEPDVLFSFDARGGIWAQDIAERLNVDAPIIIGFRLKPRGPRKATSRVCFSQCHLIETRVTRPAENERERWIEVPRWHLLVPPALVHLSNTKRVLFVDDYTNTGDTCWAIKRYLVDERGFSPENVRTLTLVSTEEAIAQGRPPDFSPHITPARRADLFYMFRR